MDSLMPVIALSLLVICLIFKWQYSYWTRRGVEGLSPLPIFGNYFECFLMQKHFTDNFDEIYCHSPKAKYVGFYKFHSPGLVLRDLKLIRRILSGDLCDNYQSAGITNDNIYLLCKEALFAPKVHDSEMTRTAIKAYFTEKRFKENFSKLRTVSQNLIDFIEGSPEWTSKEDFEAKELSSKFTIEAVMACALNVGANCFTQPESDFLELYQKYFLGKSYGGLLGLLSSRVEKQIENSLNSKFIPTEGFEDNFSALFGAHNKHNLIQCLVVLFDVFESCNTLTAYCLYELALNGDMQKKIRNNLKEIQSGTKEFAVEDIIKGLPFLDHVLFETLRMHSHIFALKRKCMKRHQIPGQFPESEEIFVEKGCHVLIPIYSIHMNSENFPEPYYFNPNRYKNSPDAIRPFPGFWDSSEFCLGFKYGFLVTKLVIAMILFKFQVVLTSKNTGVLTFSKKTSHLSSEEGIWLTFSKLS